MRDEYQDRLPLFLCLYAKTIHEQTKYINHTIHYIMKQSFISKWHCKLLVCSFCLAMFFPLSLFAESGTWGNNLTWNLSTDSVLTISGTGAMEEAKGWSLTYPWADYKVRNKIASVVIEEGVTTIAASAFQSCGKLHTASLPSTLQVIGSSAFESSKLTSVTLPESLDSIYARAFSSTKIQHVTIPQQLKYIGDRVFYTSSLITVAWNAIAARTDSNSPFYSCSSLTKITFGEGVKVIPNSLCYDLRIQEVDLPESLDSIGREAFYNTSLTEITIPEGVEYIGSAAFSSAAISTVYWNAISCKISSNDYYELFDSNVTTFVFGDKVQYIPASLCTGLSSLTEVTIPSSVDTIADKAFYRSGLTSVTIPDGVEYIGSGVFGQCSNLETFTWNVSRYEQSAEDIQEEIRLNIFASSSYSSSSGGWVKNVIVGDNVEVIPAYLFASCSLIQHLTLPAKLDSIGDGAFSDAKLKRITLPASLRYIGERAIGSDTHLEHLEILTGATPMSSLNCDTIDMLVLRGDTIHLGRWIDDNVIIGSLEYDKSTVFTGGTGQQGESIETFAHLNQSDDEGYTLYDIDSDGSMDGIGIYTPTGSFNDNENWFFNTLGFRKEYCGDKNSWQLFYPLDYNKDGVTDWLVCDKGQQIKEDYSYYYPYFLNIYTHNGDSLEAKHIHTTKHASPVFGDINSDGRADVLLKDTILIQQVDGSFLPQVIKFLEPSEVDSMLYKEHTNSGGFVSGTMQSVSLGYNMFVYELQEDKSQYILMDLDKNGKMDYVNPTNGNILLNFGDNSFRKSNLGGRILDVKDLNGDAIPDLLLFDETKETTSLLYYENGELKTKVLATDLVVTRAWCYDFDRDGDADILLAFDYDKQNQHSFLIFYRNDGANTWRTKENSFANELTFIDCKDVDNDGLYEVVAYKSETVKYGNYEESKGSYVVIRCTNALKANIDLSAISPLAQGIFQDNEDDYRKEWSEYDNWALGDFDGDGRIEYTFSTSYYYHSTQNNSYFLEFSSVMNTAPQQMERPSTLFDGYNQTLQISWGDGVDTESSSVDLSYALRIGTAPGKSDLLYAHAKADGTRLNLREGNMRHEHQYTFDVSGLPVGSSIYIAVQAIDPNYRGGAWSEETVYQHKTISAGFSLDRYNFTTADTVIVALKGEKQAGYTYDWDFGEGAIIVADTLNYVYLSYHSIGDRDITLHVTDTAGNSATTTKSVHVTGCKFEEFEFGKYPEYLLLDFDQNSVIDGVGYTGGFLENDGNGTFTAVGNMYNLNLSLKGNPSYYEIVDYNKDGLPDVFMNTNKGNMFVNVEEKMFEIETISSLFSQHNVQYDDQHLYDFNNDGNPDMYTDRGKLIAGLDNLQFETLEDKKIIGDELGVTDGLKVDINSDGYLDILATRRDNHLIEDGAWYNLIAINHGNWNFTIQYLYDAPDLNFGGFYSTVNCVYGDINNDGYIDLISHPTTRTVKVYYGDKDLTFAKQKTFYMPPSYEAERILWVYDMDNNGYLDIVAELPGRNDGSRNQQTYILWNNGSSFDAEEVCFGWYGPRYGISNFDTNGSPDFGGYLNRTNITNEAPQAPTNLRMYQTTEGVVLEWDVAQDKETPSTQMRYNLGVKKAGATGESAYIVSPMNGGKDEAAIIPSYPYLHSTRYVMPFSAFEVGKQYEFTVQAIDGWGATKTSEPCTFTVLEGGGILVSNYEVCIGEEVTLTYNGTEVGTPIWDAGSGTIEVRNGQTIVKWHTSGVQTVVATVNGKRYEATVYITPGDQTSIAFTLPKMVLGGAPIKFTLPAAFADASNEIWIDGDATIQRRGNTLDAVAYFPEKDGEYQITIHYMTKGACSQEITYTQTTQVVGNNITPIISIVGIDAGSGKTVVNWDVPENVFTRTDLFDKIWVQKEQGRTNNFVTVAELPLTATKYIDMASDPTQRKARYRIVLSTHYGGESKPSEVHSNVHVMLNTGLHNSVNIIWTPYEGAVIDQYTILRGTSPDNLQVLTTASGYESSYTDKNIVEGETYYYALSYSNTYETEWITIASGKRNKPARTYANTATGTSNVVASEESVTTVFPTSLTIRSLETEQKLTDGQDVLHLYPEILPANATIKRVAWSITQGSDLATINENGELSYIGNGESGTVTIEARTIDGSNLTATLNIKVEYIPKTVGVEQITISPDAIQMTVGDADVLIQATISPTNATNQNITWRSTNTDVATVAVQNGMSNYISGIASGTAMIIATTEDGNFSDTCVVNVQVATVAVEGISVTPTDVTLCVGETQQLQAIITPANATNQTVNWTTHNKDIVRVENGLIYALSQGITTVTVTTEDGGYNASCVVTVNDNTTTNLEKANADNAGCVYKILEDGVIYIVKPDGGKYTIDGQRIL